MERNFGDPTNAKYNQQGIDAMIKWVHDIINVIKENNLEEHYPGMIDNALKELKGN